MKDDGYYYHITSDSRTYYYEEHRNWNYNPPTYITVGSIQYQKFIDYFDSVFKPKKILNANVKVI